MPLPDVYYGKVTDEIVDWRNEEDHFEDTDDDEELEYTPASVIEILGFDPKETA